MKDLEIQLQILQVEYNSICESITNAVTDYERKLHKKDLEKVREAMTKLRLKIKKLTIS